MHWTTSKITRTFVFSVLATLISLVSATPGMTSPADVRVLVDVSGSMKNADPKAVRGPATALLAALLPDRSKGGIWLFGSDVRELVPYGPVDARWDALGKPIEAPLAQQIVLRIWRVLSKLVYAPANRKLAASVM